MDDAENSPCAWSMDEAVLATWAPMGCGNTRFDVVLESRQCGDENWSPVQPRHDPGEPISTISMAAVLTARLIRRAQKEVDLTEILSLEQCCSTFVRLVRRSAEPILSITAPWDSTTTQKMVCGDPDHEISCGSSPRLYHRVTNITISHFRTASCAEM